MKISLTVVFLWASIGCMKIHGQAVCNVSNAQVNGYVLTATSTGGHLCAWQAGGGGGGAVSSVFGRTGAVVAVSGDYAVGQVTGAAPLANPAFTGNPTAPTQTGTDNSTRLATTAFVQALVGSGGCPTCLLGTPVEHGVVLSGAAQTTNITTAGTAGQPLISGGPAADGDYGALNLAGGSSIVTGILPAANHPTASSVAKGIIQGDGSTITITAGVAACTTLTTSQIGCARIDGTSITISGGVLSAHLAGGAISGTGTTNFVPVFTGITSIGNSSLQDNGSAISTTEQLTAAGLVSSTFIQASGNITALAGGDFNCGTGCLGYYVLGTQVINPSRQFIGTDVTGTGNFNVGGTLNVTGSSFIAGLNASSALFTSNVLMSGLAAGSGADTVLCISSGSVLHKGGCASGLAGSGTTNFIPKFTSSSAIGNSAMQDNGSLISSTEQFQAVGLVSTTFIQASGNITALSGGSFNCGTGCLGYYVQGNQAISPTRQFTGTDAVMSGNGNFTGSMTIGASEFVTGGINTDTFIATSTVAMSGLPTGTSGLANVCIETSGLHRLFVNGCGGGSVSAPVTLGSGSFTGANALTVQGAGAFNNTNDYSPIVSLLGASATDTRTMNNFFHTYQAGHLVGTREGAVEVGVVNPSGSTNWEADGIISMAVNHNTAVFDPSFGGFYHGNAVVAGSFFALNAAPPNGTVKGAAFGINTKVQDYENDNTTAGHHWPSILIGSEFDMTMADTGSAGVGSSYNVAWANGKPTAESNGINFVGINAFGYQAYFDKAIDIVDGAALVGLSLRGQPASNSTTCPGCNALDSSFIQFLSGGSTLFGHLYANASGSIVLAPDVGHTGNTLKVLGGSGNVTADGSFTAGGAIQTNASGAVALYAPNGNLWAGGSGFNTIIGSLSIGGGAVISGGITVGGIITGLSSMSLTGAANISGALNATSTGNNQIYGTLFQGTSQNIIMNGGAAVPIDAGNKIHVNGVSGVANGNSYIVASAFGGPTGYLGGDNFSGASFGGSFSNHPYQIRINNSTRVTVDTSSGMTVVGNLTAAGGLFTANSTGTTVNNFLSSGNLAVFGTSTVGVLNANTLSLFGLSGAAGGSHALCMNGTTVTLSSTNTCP